MTFCYKQLIFLLVYVLSSSLAIISCNASSEAQKNITEENSPPLQLKQLAESISYYNGKDVFVEAFYIEGFEYTVLANNVVEKKDGRFYTDGIEFWVSWGKSRPANLIRRFSKESVVIPGLPPTRYARVLAMGQFQASGGFGHLGQYEYSFIIKEIRFFDKISGKFIPGEE